jgi:hypothetical protein
LTESSQTLITSFRTGDERTADIECDPLTFSSSGPEVIWSKSAYLDEVFAFAIPAGTCGIAPPDCTGDCTVHPVASCITHRAGDVYARFGYRTSQAATISIGPDNFLSGGTIVSGAQPVSFAAGDHANEFEVRFDHKDSVRWTLDGNSATADRHTRNCHAF